LLALPSVEGILPVSELCVVIVVTRVGALGSMSQK